MHEGQAELERQRLVSLNRHSFIVSNEVRKSENFYFLLRGTK